MKPVALLLILLPVFCTAQNLVVNSGAENAITGSGWTIVNGGPDACPLYPSNTVSNWTLAPDNSANYPAARSGSRTFFAGCSNAIGASFEMFQDIDISAYSAQVDAGQANTIFSGFIQTPVSGQGDAGRFVVDFKDANGATLGTSYTSTYQSNSLGSGNSWRLYMNTRTAPVGSRKVRIRLQSLIIVLPAINAYFDDMSFTMGATILPVTLTAFSGKAEETANMLKWTVADQSNLKQMIVERSLDNQQWYSVQMIDATTSKVAKDYSYIDATPSGNNFYRLRLLGQDGKVSYSKIVEINRKGLAVISLYPNPAANQLTIEMGKSNQGKLSVSNIGGAVILSRKLSGASTENLDISKLERGFYFLDMQYADGSRITRKFSKS